MFKVKKTIKQVLSQNASFRKDKDLMFKKDKDIILTAARSRGDFANTFPKFTDDPYVNLVYAT